MKLFLLTAVVVICSTVARADEDPVVCFEKGCVRGINYKGNFKEFEGFLGIPYARPPVDELRLKDPEPIDEKFDGVYNATKEKNYCMQKNYLLPSPTVSGVEDCLYLYVYRPKISIKRRRKLLPVIVYIHGGGFFAGSAGPSITGADYFMDTEDVIFVTMNYRLGPLGFLSTGDLNMPGNFALKDQALAIKWVRDNIKAFGGNASNVILMGQSAGASSAHLHMMSNPKLSRNMFHKVVMLSGNGNGPYAYPIKDPMEQAKSFAKAVGIADYEKLSRSELAQKLRHSSPEDLINACDKLKIWSVDPLTISRPVIEDCDSHKGFLCEDPAEAWRTGNSARVPILTGFMDQDGGVRALRILEDENQFKDLNKRFDELIPKLMEIEVSSPEATEKNLKKITDRYFNGTRAVPKDKSIIRLYTERSFIAPLHNTLQQLMMKHDHQTPAYLYKFSFKGRYSYSKFYTGNEKPYGPVHCDELIYLLKSPILFPEEFENNSQEAIFRTKFVKFFTDFALNGKPSKINGRAPQRCESSNLKSGFKCNYVEFGENLNMSFDDKIDESIAEFWNDIDPTLVKTTTSSSLIEVSQIMRSNTAHRNFVPGS